MSNRNVSRENIFVWTFKAYVNLYNIFANIFARNLFLYYIIVFPTMSDSKMFDPMFDPTLSVNGWIDLTAGAFSTPLPGETPFLSHNGSFQAFKLLSTLVICLTSHVTKNWKGLGGRSHYVITFCLFLDPYIHLITFRVVRLDAHQVFSIVCIFLQLSKELSFFFNTCEPSKYNNTMKACDG